MQRRLLDGIDDYDTPEFRALDRQAADTFDAILQHSPSNADEAQALISFFLDIIANDEGCGSGRLIERVRELTETLVACVRARPGSERGHGAGA
ncbi:hypothetical protein IB238_10845 [Rhizobium sp. ARZ01]|uniref:hypothetical protein n=1 Tax=Rhizobium sp. ARZ01 TaxID=2769313 RepID=UPI001782D67E|nr:hypothetical protein [Rhizobium sp. ARZ01]MBD9373116.1 hypothetical protein [Rhizobium sp. ARZ01]